jgi:broad specificity phosphatase PhoE
MALLLVRHGETSLNAARTLQPPDTPLSDLGVRQARSLAKRLAREHRVTQIVSSELLRARQTADCVANHLGVLVRYESDLAERNFGCLRGQPYDRLGFDPLAMEEAPEDGESLEQFRRRVARVFRVLCSEEPSAGGDLLVVSHGLVLRSLFELRLIASAHRVIPSPGNASLTVIEAKPPYAVLLGPCAVHLEEALGSPKAEGRALA